ncbi:unnamed protein product [Cuscuta campestris]|uniref:DUF1985 domain-containing protein n=1 Tax=Cuscuta campestris TaxID=132261 RepID=A0A484M1G9_9ASTE|nr:unnamed protein product [Cuscuta campestris]
MKFKIKGRKVLFTKPEFELIAGLGGGGNRITLNDERLGDFGLRYFNTGKSVQRCHITDALLQHNRDDPRVESDDVVKLALLHLLGNVMFGHQSRVSFPIGYINLVDDFDAFDKFPWGEVIWEELLTHAGRCAQSLKARGRGRVTFGGSLPYRWEIYAKISAQFLHEAIFENPEFEVSKIVPSERELNDPSLALFASEYIRRGIDDTVQHIESSEKVATVARNLSVGSAKKRKLSTTGNAQNKPKEKRKRIIHSMEGEFLPKRKSKRKKESQSQIITILNDMKKMQESQGKVLKMILEQLEKQKGDDTEERGFKKIDDEIVNENVESEDMENKNMGKDTILEKDGTDHGYVGKDGTSRHDDNDLGHVDTTVINEGDDKIKEGMRDERSIGTLFKLFETQFSDQFFEQMDKEVNAILKGTIEGNIFEKESGSDMEPAANANFKKVQMDSTIDEQGITLPEEGMAIKGKCMDVDVATKELVEHVKMDTIIDAQPISEYNGNAKNEAPCVLTRKSKRQTKEPQKLSLSGRKVQKKTQKMKEAVKSKFKVTLSQMEVVIGPFSLNPKEMHPQEDIDKLKTFLECGMLKRKARTGVRKIYTKGDENMTKKPIVLDKFIISSKTWLYDLFMDQEWLDTLHMEVGMFYLEVKRFNYKLTQTYSTVTPFFLECLKRHQDDIDKKIKTKEDVGKYLMMDMDIRDIRTDQMAAYRMKMATELVRFAESNMAAKE